MHSKSKRPQADFIIYCQSASRARPRMCHEFLKRVQHTTHCSILKTNFSDFMLTGDAAMKLARTTGKPI
jgi:hypothetical protein